MASSIDINKPNPFDKLDEEFNNFMHKVTEVSNIVKKLASSDKNLQEIGDVEARRYLGELRESILENINEEEVILKVKSSKTVINKKALQKESGDQATMSQEAFMEEISKDADRRYHEKLIRREKMETFKKQATLAFRRREYDRALSLYTKAIEQIKDSCLLYNNRALTFINLNMFEKAKEDLKTALKLNEDCLKSWLLLARIHFIQKNVGQFEENIKEALKRNPGARKIIEDFVVDTTSNKSSDFQAEDNNEV